MVSVIEERSSIFDWSIIVLCCHSHLLTRHRFIIAPRLSLAYYTVFSMRRSSSQFIGMYGKDGLCRKGWKNCPGMHEGSGGIQ